jgi:hypothetical protein
LTKAIFLGPDKIDSDKKLDTVACLFLALRDGLRSLDAFYRDLVIPPEDQKAIQVAPRNCFFPHVQSYAGPNGRVEIKYIAQIGTDDKNKAVFKGETADGQKIVVKFTDRYNAAAHRMLAERNLAPGLLYVSSESTDVEDFGYKVMIVMEFVAGQTAEKQGHVTPTS